MCCGSMGIIYGSLYMLAQILGGVCGSALVLALLTREQFEFINGGVTLPSEDASIGQVLVTEFSLATVLVVTILRTAVDSKPSNLPSLAFAMIILANALAGNSISGPSVNPARSFGPALITGIWTHHWIYWVGPISGSLFSVLVFKLILASADTRWVLKRGRRAS
ncbi:aquaporin-8-like [Ptychodera flava]|uniref:aquaporin-8-like n=1 Tax=Ptychodera flava TaxID=63121 RepID=UPI00396A5575